AMCARGRPRRRSGRPQPPGRVRDPVVRLTSRWCTGSVCGDSPAVSGAADDVPDALRRPASARGWGPGSAPPVLSRQDRRGCNHRAGGGVLGLGGGGPSQPGKYTVAKPDAYGYATDVATIVTNAGSHPPTCTIMPSSLTHTTSGCELCHVTRWSSVPDTCAVSWRNSSTPSTTSGGSM